MILPRQLMIFPLFRRKLIRGAEEHLKAGLGVACDYTANHEDVFAPFSGVPYTFKEPKGGNWLGIKREDGVHVQFAHLQQYYIYNWLGFKKGKVKAGELVALSGNSGLTTTGPHLHVQVLDSKGQRLDPEKFFFAKNIPVVAANTTIPQMRELQKKVLEFSGGMLTITWDIIIHPIVESGMLLQDKAYALADQLFDKKYLPYRYLFLTYQGNAPFLTSFYYPKKNMCITTAPENTDPRLLAFEFSHQLQKWYNENRPQGNSAVEVTDSNFPNDDFIINKYRLVLPYRDLLVGRGV